MFNYQASKTMSFCSFYLMFQVFFKQSDDDSDSWLSLFTKNVIFGCYWMMLQQSFSMELLELFLHVGHAL